MEGYTPPYKKTVVRYELVFYREPGWGLGFSCDENGNVDMDKMADAAKKNYKYAMQHPEDYPCAWNEVEKIETEEKYPATGICYCGNRIELTDEDIAACKCPHCGQWWSLSGQALKPRERWNDYGELDGDDD